MAPLTAAAGRGWRRTVLALGGIIVAVAVVAIGVMIATTRPPAAYPAGSPEAAFQAYLQAWEADDVEAAYASFSSRVRDGITLEHYRLRLHEYGWARSQDRRVVLVERHVTGSTAVLDLRIDEFAEGGMGGTTYSSETSVRLVREDGSWRMDQLLAGLEPIWVEQ